MVSPNLILKYGPINPGVLRLEMYRNRMILQGKDYAGMAGVSSWREANVDSPWVINIFMDGQDLQDERLVF